MKFRNVAGAALALVLSVGGVVALSAAPASATEECVPVQAVAAYDEVVTITEAYDEVVTISEAIPAKWVNYNWTGGPVEGEPEWPGEGWNSNNGEHGGHPQPVDGEPGFSYDVSHGSSGNADWFHWDFEPAVDAVTETVHHDAVTETIHHEAVPGVTCEEEPVEIAPAVCAASGDWYTEGDDVAPVQTEDGLLFTTTGEGVAVGIRTPASGNLQGWDSVSFSADGDTSEFFFRIVIDASADGGKAYQSLSFPGVSTIDADSVAYQTGTSISEIAETWPNAVITSIGFQTNSGAEAGIETVLTSISGACLEESFVPVVIPPTEEPEPTTPPVVTPPVVAAPAAVVAQETPAALAETGYNVAPFALSAVAGLLAAGAILLAAAGLNRRAGIRRQS